MLNIVMKHNRKGSADLGRPIKSWSEDGISFLLNTALNE
jgi:hypothetical protein